MYQVQTIFWHNRVKRLNSPKRDKTYFVLGCVGVWVCGCVKEKNFLYVVAKLRVKSPKNVKIPFSYSFAVEMGHLDMVR